ncbi:uncharacterized protein LOC117520379 isoform X2 [Thalassophryne amazonica]|uniref:uncharacterized protein LOC117520379 isoform X2 n=1 Tax=Thalassophryne amazonica TaxID=390379 RepID=UPI0014714CD3|nr:uncharacterized protein LOC117520379 isoform X2 [Thalassophryne amazonica]
MAIQKTNGENFYSDVPKQAGMNKLSPADNRGYNFRKKDNILLLRKNLTVTDVKGVSDLREGGTLTIPLSPECTSCNMFYTNKWDKKRVIVMKAGILVEDGPFRGRIRKLNPDEIQILSLKHQDSGCFEVIDQQGFIVFLLDFYVQESYTTTISFAWICIPAILILVVILCIFVYKRLCRKNRAAESAPLIAEVPPMSHTAYQTTGQCPPPYPSLNPTRIPEARTGFAAVPVAAPAQQYAAPVCPGTGLIR